MFFFELFLLLATCFPTFLIEQSHTVVKPGGSVVDVGGLFWLDDTEILDFLQVGQLRL